jgi:hypothetical protein
LVSQNGGRNRGEVPEKNWEEEKKREKKRMRKKEMDGS